MLRLLLPLLLVLAACTERGPREVTVTVTAVVPDDTDTVYLAGNLDSLGPWRADGLAMSGDGTSRTARLTMPEGQAFEYKFTLGDWSREAVDENGFPYPNFSLVAAPDLTARNVVAGFKPERGALLDDWQGSGVLGTLVYWRDVESAFLEPSRHVEVWLPPGYDDPGNADKRYPVIYMTDGENLFDPRIANTGVDWGIDEAIMQGVGAGLFGPAIVVGHWSTRKRLEEYSPWHEGPQLARFVIEELKPRVDAEFRTLTDAANTFAMGSSMGGLNAMYLVMNHPDTFSACGCLSTHVPLSERIVAEVLNRPVPGTDATPYVMREIENGGLRIPEGTRMFFDYGTETLDAGYGPVHQQMRRHFGAQGRTEGVDFLVLEYPGAAHDEASWRARALDQLAWLLAGKVPGADGSD